MLNWYDLRFIWCSNTTNTIWWNKFFFKTLFFLQKLSVHTKQHCQYLTFHSHSQKYPLFSKKHQNEDHTKCFLISLEFQSISGQFVIADSMFSQHYPEICNKQFHLGGDFCSRHCSNLVSASEWWLLLLLSAALNYCIPQLVWVFRKSLQLSPLWLRLKKKFWRLSTSKELHKAYFVLKFP